MKLVFLMLIFVNTLAAQESELLRNAIQDPAQSIRCKELFKEREEKISMKQKLSGLIQRNEVLQRRTPDNKQSLKKRLEANHVKVRNEIYLNALQIQTTEEKIVRSGCPGLNL
jgi:hypothetical protein